MHVALKLYRAILREHRKKLPPQMRALGDKYVGEEFRHHRNAKAEFLPEFYHAWQSYLMNLHGPIEATHTALESDGQPPARPPGMISNTLSSSIHNIREMSENESTNTTTNGNTISTQTIKFGQDLSHEIYSALSEEQKEQLNKLQKEATKLSKER